MKALFCLLLSFAATAGTEWTKNLKLPKGFKLHKFLEVKDARQMTLAPDGTLFVGTRRLGVVYAIDPMGKIREVFKNLNMPQGVLWENGELYVAEVHQISKTKDLKTLTQIKTFPTSDWHGWKSINKGPDGKLYVPIGAPCNICNEQEPYAAMHRMDFDGKNFETIAKGIRNTVGFTWHPETKQLWFTDMGVDRLGDDIPSDEINVIAEKGQHFGYPYFHANIPEKHHPKPKDLKVTAPAFEVRAHSAPIGIAFFPKDKYPKEFHDCFLLAEHGSWYLTKKLGYQVMKGCLKEGKVASYDPFITGFKVGETVFARPVHFLFLADGSFYLSDDEPGTVLHFKYTP